MQIHPISFFVSLAIGLFIVYISTPVPEVIIMYPTPQNVENVTYQDINQVCYRYKMDQKTCPRNKKEIYQLPIQNVSIEKKQNQGMIENWKHHFHPEENSSAYKATSLQEKESFSM